MSGAKEIKARMSGVRETKQITNAMYLVASTKLRHAREALEATNPYFTALRKEISRIFRMDETMIGRYFVGGAPQSGVCGILAVTGDKGLAGAYNLNVIRRTEAVMREKPNARLFVIGEYGRRYFLSHRAPVERDFLYTAQDLSQNSAREICTVLLDLYEAGELNEIDIVYTDMESSISSETKIHRLLPLEPAAFRSAGGDAPTKTYDFFPSQEVVLGVVLRSYLSGFIYSAVVDSLCSEQNARVTAMDAAGRNAEELLDALSLQLNRERQAAITQEITEISAGAKAQRRARGR